MMQINCPFCGGRDETEFSYGGEAHITRPALDVDDKQWADSPLLPQQREGRAR